MAHRIVKKFLLIFLPMFLVSFAFGQSKYNTTTYSVIANNLTNCKNSSCFQPVLDSAWISNMASGFDGFVLGVGSDCHLWNQTMTTPTVKSAWVDFDNSNCFYGVAIRTRSEYFALTYTSACAPYGYAVNRNLGSGFSVIDGCLTQMSITKDDTLVGINAGGQLFYALNAGTGSSLTWVYVPNGTFTYAVGLNASSAFALGGYQVYKVDLVNQTYTPLSGSPGSATSLAVTGSALYVTTTTGAVWRLDFPNNTWSLLQGTMSRIYGNTEWSLHGLDGNNGPHHYLSHAVFATVNIHGYYDCSQFPNGCPIGAKHTATAMAQFTGGTSVSASKSGAPADTLDATAQAWAPGCDFFYGDAESSYCVIQVATGQVECSKMGPIVTQAFGGKLPVFNYEFAHSRMIGTASPVCYTDTTATYAYCRYPVAQHCVNPPPDFDPVYVDADTRSQYIDFDVSSSCISVNHSPWACLGALATLADKAYPIEIGVAHCDVKSP